MLHRVRRWRVRLTKLLCEQILNRLIEAATAKRRYPLGAQGANFVHRAAPLLPCQAVVIQAQMLAFAIRKNGNNVCLAKRLAQCQQAGSEQIEKAVLPHVQHWVEEAE